MFRFAQRAATGQNTRLNCMANATNPKKIRPSEKNEEQGSI
jgi:hypothetical protein